MSTIAASCPICSAPAAADHAPFCGPLCRDRDLLNWLGESYRVPVESEEEPAGGSGGILPSGMLDND